MDLDELRSVRRTERQKDSLQHLRDSFYEDVATYIQARKAERRRAADAADDPFGDPEVGQLTDEIGTAEDVVEAIYERRVGKVVKLASFAAADMSADKSGLTVEERALFDDLVERIKRNRQSILDTLAGEGGGGSDADIDVDTAAPSPADSAAEPPTDGPPTSEGVGAADADAAAADPAASGSDPGGSAGAGDDQSTPEVEPTDDPPAPDDVLAAAMGGDGASTSGPDPEPEPETETKPGTDVGEEPVPPEAVDEPEQDVPVVDGAETDGGNAAVTAGGASPEDDRVTLKITADVGRIYGVDEREYDLESEDVVRLPATNAGPLVERDAAERLE